MSPGAIAEMSAGMNIRENIERIIRMALAKNAEGMSGGRKNAGWTGLTKQPVSMASTGVTTPVVMANTVIMAITVNRASTNTPLPHH